MELKTVITIFVLLTIGTVTIAWSHQQGRRQLVPAVETISPEALTLGRGPISETKFRDMSVVFVGDGN
jgi:hypothetical protein